MLKCNIVYTSRDLVGNNLLVKAEIFQEGELFNRLLDVIEVTVIDNASMPDEDIQDYVLNLYNSQL